MAGKGSAIGRQKLIEEILRYLVDHPDAKDTIEGIIKWWLPGDVEWARAEVQEALTFLTAKGWLTTRETAPAKAIYGLNKFHLEAIKRFAKI